MHDNSKNNKQQELKLSDSEFIDSLELSDIHCHLGFAADYKTLWEIVVRRGLSLPFKNFKEFKHSLSVRENLTPSHRGNYLKLNLYDITEEIQSEPEAIRECVFSAISKGYRCYNLTLFEIRFNPILRSLKGRLSIDCLITAAIHGLEMGQLAYPVKAGLILSMDRRLSKEENAKIVDAAIRFKDRGIIGIDIAGPTHINENARMWRPSDIKDLVEKARAAGLGITIHSGDITDAAEVREVVEVLEPDRIGHGVYAAYDQDLLNLIASKGIVLETCPEFYKRGYLSEEYGSLNLVKDFGGLGNVYALFKRFGVKFTINTDGAEMQDTSIREILINLLKDKILTREDVIECLKISREASFIKNRN